MARRYANVSTDRWERGSSYRRLTHDGQWLYHLLESQPEISACGALPLRPRRWAAMAEDVGEDFVWKVLGELADSGTVVIDEDTEEVLIRAFTRADGGYGNPRRLPSIRDAANAVESPSIVRALAAEFEDLGVGAQWRGQASIECLSISHSDTGCGVAAGAIGASETCHTSHDANSGPHAEKPQVNSHSDPKNESTDSLTDEQRRVPQPTTHNPQPVEETSSSTETSPTDADDNTESEPVREDVLRLCAHLADRIEANGSKRPTIGKTWLDACRLMIDRDGRTEEQVTKAIDWCQDNEFWRGNIMSMPTLRKQYDRLRLAAQAEARKFSEKPQQRPSTTDQRVQAALQLGAEMYEAEQNGTAQNPFAILGQDTPQAIEGTCT